MDGDVLGAIIKAIILIYAVIATIVENNVV
jgi:hypothetical protein